MAKIRTLKPTQPGQKPISFHPGGEHESTGTPPDEPIPAVKKRAAKAGKFGSQAQKQELFRENVLTGGR